MTINIVVLGMWIVLVLALVALIYVLNGMRKQNEELHGLFLSTQGEVIHQKKERERAEDEAARLWDERDKATPKPSCIIIYPYVSGEAMFSGGHKVGSKYIVSKETGMEIETMLKELKGKLQEGKPFIIRTVDGIMVAVERRDIKSIHVQVGD